MKTAFVKTFSFLVLTGMMLSYTPAFAAAAKKRTPAQSTPQNAQVAQAPQAAPAAAVHPKFTYATIKAIENFSQRRLTDQDFESVKKVVQTLELLDEQDPSRTAVMMLSESYGKHKRIYDRAFRALETQKNKVQLEEIREVMMHFNEDGNG